MDILQGALLVALKLSAPLLLVSIAIGLVVAIFQAATQIHEQTLTFVPKALTIVVLLLLLAPMMISSCNEFLMRIFELITQISSQRLT